MPLLYVTFRLDNKTSGLMLKTCAGLLPPLVEPVLQVTIVSSSSGTVKKKKKKDHTVDDMFGSLVYTAWLYPGAAV